MGNEYFDNLTSDIMYKNHHLQQINFNGILKTTNAYTCFSRHNGGTKSDVKNFNKKNGFTKSNKNFNDSFGTNFLNSKYLSRQIDNSVQETSITTLESYNSSYKNKESNFGVVEISSDDSLSIIENDRNISPKCNIKETITNLDKKIILNSNGHINSREFKKRKVIVRLKKLNFESTGLSKRAVRQLRKRINFKENNIKYRYSHKNDKKSKQMRGKHCSLFADYFIEDVDSNKCDYKYIKNIKTEENKKIKTVSRKKKNHTTSIQHLEKSEKVLKNDKLFKTVPLFETIFVDTVNIDETNSESSPMLQDYYNKSNTIFKTTNNQSNIFNSKIKILKTRKILQDKKLSKGDISRKNNLKTRLKDNNVNKIDKTGKIKHCKIVLKNLSPKEIIEKIEESKYRASRRRRSWSVSDVAREHDRRLNFFPEAGPSHINYYALIKLPVVKPKVPVNY